MQLLIDKLKIKILSSNLINFLIIKFNLKQLINKNI